MSSSAKSWTLAANDHCTVILQSVCASLLCTQPIHFAKRQHGCCVRIIVLLAGQQASSIWICICGVARLIGTDYKYDLKG